MQFTTLLSITTSEREALVAKSIVSREQEILAYEVNISVYERAAVTATGEYLAQLTELIAAETRERDKCLVLRNALMQEIPQHKLSSAIVAATKG